MTRKRKKTTMEWAVQGVRAQMRWGSTAAEAVDYIRWVLSLSRQQTTKLANKFISAGVQP